MSKFKLPEFQVFPVPATRARSAGDIADWGHEYLSPDGFWEQGYTGRGVVVIVIDTGIDDTHPDLVGQVIHRKDFTNESSDSFDPNGHGTWCASRIAGIRNDQGVIGIAPDVKLVDLRVLGADGGGSNSAVAAAFRYAVDMVLPEPYQGWRRVTSVSLGSKFSSSSVKTALEYAVSRGVINVCAAGNSGYKEGTNTINYPARYDEFALAVGAIDSNEDIAPYSSAGDELDIVSPGSYLLGAWLDGDYAYISGTSMATPHVAGAVALLIGKYSRELATHQDVEMYLQVEAKDLLTPGWDLTSGSGSVVLTRYEDTPPGDVVPDPDPEPEPEQPAGVWAWFVGILAAVWQWLKNIFSRNQINTAMEKEIKKSAQEDIGQFGRAEIVDTLTDGCKLEISIRNKWAPGTGTNIIFKIIESSLAAYPKIDEAIKDWPTFEAELLDLFPAESGAVLEDVGAGLTEDEKNRSRLFRVIRFAARGHLNGEQVKQIIDEQWSLGKNIFARA